MTTYRQPRGLPPWFQTHRAPLPANMPELEPLQPNPNYRPQPAPRAAKRQPTRHKGPGKAALQAQARSQPRDREGRFAEKGGWFKNRWNAWLDLTPRPSTRLKKKRPTRAVQQRPLSEIRTAAPVHKKAKKRKKPVPERGFFGRVASLFNGDYTRWRMANLRQQARLRAAAPPSNYRRGVLRRFFPF